MGGYELLARIGEGGMGVVHLARQPGGDRVALKVLRPHIVGDQEARERLAREVNSLKRIRSRRVAEIVDADPWGDIPFVATRYVPGLSLSEHVNQEGPITGPDLTWFAWCLAEALSDVHACGVLHRDVKPSNVLMEGRTPILIDFGLARVADDPKLTHTGWLLGTPGYLAPEILHGHDASVASDVHSWAATVAYAGIGRSPFGTGPSMAIMDRVRRGEHDLSDLPSPLQDVVASALSAEPSKRPSLPWLLSWLRREVGRTQGVNGIALVPPMEESPDPTPDTIAMAAYSAPIEAAPETAHDTPAPIHTRVLPPEDPEPTFAEAEPEAEPTPAPSWAERIRRTTLVGVGAIAAGVAVAAYPYLATLGLITAVWLLRSLSHTATAAGDRQRVRGQKWYDAPLAVLTSPWHLVASIPGTLLLVVWSLGIALAAGLIGFALSLDAISTLVLIGAFFAGSLWLGPGGSRLRGPVRRVTHPASRQGGSWSLALTFGLVLVAVPAWYLWQNGIDWSPAAEGPLSRAPQWPDWLPR